ncbi:MAG TPA: chemotaxis protein CheA, partial [Polyangiaceae bacterium]|nr:chemotaxis protein CheA [Polyangiaceae bacterium]
MDPSALIAFLDEADDALQTVNAEFVQLEAEPANPRKINACFRAIHSIKGNAPFFGLVQVKRLTHRMEDLLALMRAQRITAGHDAISSLLAGLDLLEAMLDNVRQGRPELDAGAEASLDVVLERLSGASHAGRPEALTWDSVWQQLDEMALAGSSSEQQAALDTLRTTLLALAPAPPAPPPAADSASDSGADAVLDELEQLLEPSIDEVLPAESAERVRELLDGLLWTVTAEARQIAQRATEEHDALLAAAGFVPLLRETLLERIQEIRAALPPSPPRPSLAPRALPELSLPPLLTSTPPLGRPSLMPPVSGPWTPSGPPGAAAADGGRTMRVEESKIDEFLDYVGELIITREMFGNVGKRLRALKDHASLSTEFQRAMGAFTGLSHNLQRSIMEVRKVPVKFALQKVPRLVRDVADSAGKQASVTLVGCDICVDKSLVESFEAPLIHMVRNAVDHGLEAPEERRRRNKPPVGRVDVVVTENSAEVICAIRDDGAGIDADALRDKAVRLGLLSERAAAQLGIDETHQLVFAAGLSTASTVTDVSGRGVGMDVVKRNISERGGRIEIVSERGVGSTFTVYLPKTVTVQILDGFLVQVGRERLVLPLRAISESFRPTPDQLHTVAERGECVSRRGRVFPLVRFNRLLALDAADRSPSDAIVVSVEVAGGRPAGLLVDQVLGVQQVVLREVAGIDSEPQVFAGGAVLGDGRVAMVVDVEKLGALMA